jgi:hypothetical protein
VTPAWRIALPTAVAVLGSAVALFLLSSDAVYFIQSRTPHDLGEASALPATAPSNRYVHLRGAGDLATSLRVTSRDGAVRVVRLSGGPVLVQVPAPGPPGGLPQGEGGLAASGLFDGAGRLWRADDAKAAYAPVLRHFRKSGPVTHLLIAGDEPGGSWPSFLGAVVVSILGAAAGALALRVIRANVRRKRSAGGVDGDPGL